MCMSDALSDVPEDFLTHPYLLTVLRSGRSTTESSPGGRDIKYEHDRKEVEETRGGEKKT